MKKATLLVVLLALVAIGSAFAKPKIFQKESSQTYALAKYPGTEQQAKIEGVNIVFIDEGKGDTVIFIHGLSGDIQDWKDQIIYFKQFYRVIALDLPGHGKSEKKNEFKYGRDLFTKVVSGLLKQRGVDKAIVVGNSMGGMVAASLALAHPEQLKMLVLCDSAGINPLVGPVRIVLNRASPGMAERMWLDEGNIKKNAGKAFAHPENFPRERINEDIALIRQPDAKQYAYAMLTSLQDTAAQNLRPQLDKIVCPTLIIWGEKDAILSSSFANFWNDGIKGSHLLMVPDTGHIPMVETPDLFNKAVEIFIHGFWDDRMFNRR